MDEQPKTINMLLDVERVYGESNRRMAPIIITLCIAGAPLLLYAGFLVTFVPVWIFAIFEIIWAVRWIMIILGEEPKRLAEYKKLCYDTYASMYKLLNIKHIHDDGLIEYINGTVAYLLVCENGNRGDDIARSQMVRSIFQSLTQDYTVNVYVQNFDAGEILASRYNNIKLFKNKAAMRDCMELINHNIELASNSSFLTRTIISVKGRKQEFKQMKYTINNVLNSTEAETFKSIIIATPDAVKEIMSYDLDAHIDYEQMIMTRYSTDDYKTSKVISYDKGLDLSLFDNEKEHYDESEGFISE